MKLVRFGNPGAEKPGLVDEQGGLRDLSRVVADITPNNLSRSALEKLAPYLSRNSRGSTARSDWAFPSRASGSSWR